MKSGQLDCSQFCVCCALCVLACHPAGRWIQWAAGDCSLQQDLEPGGQCNTRNQLELSLRQNAAIPCQRNTHQPTPWHALQTFCAQPEDDFTVRQADRKYVRDCTVIYGEEAVKQHRILVMDMRIRSVKTGYRPKQKPCIRNWKLKTWQSLNEA